MCCSYNVCVLRYIAQIREIQGRNLALYTVVEIVAVHNITTGTL